MIATDNNSRQHDAHVQAFIDIVVGEYSDLSKEECGIRVGMSFWGSEQCDARTCVAKLDNLYEAQRAGLEREAHERDVFRAKLRAMGLEPNDYLDLA